jgi:sugar-specific transcriptional regulator TrmB
MSDQISQLADFGLSALQVRVYVALVRLGPCRASMISAKTRLVRPETYRVLRELCAKGLVQRNLESPSRYTATTPATALRILMEQYERKVKMLKQKAPALVNLISSSSAETTDSAEALSLVTGHESVRLLENEMINKAKEDFAVIVSKFHLIQLFDSGVGRALISAKRRGIRVRVIAEIRDSNMHFANRLARYVDVRTTHDLLFCMDVADKNKVIFGPAFPDTEEEARSVDGLDYDIQVSTRNSRFVRAMYTIFERLWEASADYNSAV